MLTVRSRSAVMVSALVAGLGQAQSVPEGYTLIELQPAAGGSASLAAAINNRGQIIGRTESKDGPAATVWDLKGSPALLTIAAGSATDALSINDEGLMVVACEGCGPGGVAISGVRLLDGTVLELPAPAEPGLASVVPRISADGSVGGRLTVESPPGSDAGEVFGVVWRLAPGPAMVPTVAGRVAEVVNNSTTLLSFYSGGMLTDAGRIVFEQISATGGGRMYALDARTGALSEFSLSGGDVRLGDVNSAGSVLTNEVDPNGGVARVFDLASQASDQILPINCDGSPFCLFATVVTGSAINAYDIAVGVADAVDLDGFVIDEAGFVWSRGAGTVDLMSLIDDGSADGWSIEANGGPVDINDAGIIVGNGINPMGDPAGYVLVPRSACDADTNGDGVVSPSDFNAWIQAFNNGCDFMP